MQLFYGKPHASASDGVIYIPGATITPPIRLSRLPLLENEAASKSYVDSAAQNLNVSRLSGQALAVSNLPAIGGHFYSLPGTNLTMYQPTGVTPGWMSSVTVNSRGQVISGTDLIAEDFPNLDYSLVSSGQPTDLAGLGITDVMSDQGGAFADNVTLIGDPVQDTHAASKGYAEAIAATGGSNGLSVGDIVAIYNPQASDEEGLLRANGGQVNIVDYPALYAKVGGQAANAPKGGYGRPWQIQSGGINPAQSLNIVGWQTTNPIPVAVLYPVCFTTKNRVYLTAGHTASGHNTSIYTAIINEAGEIGSWTDTGAVYNPSSGAFYGSSTSVILAKNKVFIFGYKFDAPDSSGYISAAINTDGTLGGFSAMNPVPFQLTGLRKDVFFKLGNKVYACVNRQVYMAEFDKDNNLGTWGIYDQMPDEYHSGGMFVVTSGFVYVINHTSASGGRSRNMLRADHDSNGNLTGWVTVPSALPQLYSTEQFYVSDKMLYILGAGVGRNQTYRLPVYPDGSLGAYLTGDNLSAYKNGAAVLATSAYVYLLGGSSGGGPETVSLMAPIFGTLTANDLSGYYGTGAAEAPSRLARLTPGAGRPWEQQYHFNTTQSAAFGSTIQYQTAPIDISDTQVVVTKDKAFFIAGTQSLAVSNTVKKVDLLPDGTLDFTWTNWNNLPKQLDKHQVVTVANKVYVMGGVDEQGTYSSSVYKSVIDQNGELGEWAAATSLPIQLAKFACTVVGDAIYTYGGLTVGGTRTANCYKAVLDADGEITGWSTNGTLPQPVSHASIAVTANYVYLIGGHNTTGYINNVYRATIDSAGQVQDMTDVGSGPVTARFEHCLVTRSHVYLMQAYDGTNSYLGRVYAAPITSQGTIGAWSSPFTRAQVTKIGCVNFVVGGKMYMVGGTDPTLATPSKRMYVTAFAGGSNDYSLYYGKGVVKYSEPTKFYLPYVNKPELSGVTYYVKY